MNHQNQLQLNKMFRMQKNTKNIQKLKKTIISYEEKQYLKNILMNKMAFKENPMDKTIFDTDLIIKVQYPENKYKLTSKIMSIAQLMKKPNSKLSEAYSEAFSQLTMQMEENDQLVDKATAKKKAKVNQNIIRIRQATAIQRIMDVKILQKIKKSTQQNLQFSAQNIHRQDAQDSQFHLFHRKKQKLIKDTTIQQKVNESIGTIHYNCQEKYSGILDEFIINLNSLIYLLQHDCRFKVRSFVFSRGKSPKGFILKQPETQKIQHFFDEDFENQQRQIFIFLFTPDQILLKAANNFQLKKQLHYPLLDPFLNQPTDSKNRYLRYHTDFDDKDSEDELIEQSQNKMEKPINSHLILKKQERKLKLKGTGNNTIKNKSDKNIFSEAKLTEFEKDKYLEFTHKLLDQSEKIVGKQGQVTFHCQSQQRTLLSAKQLEYVKFINRGKYNKGVQKVFMQSKKQRQYIEKLGELGRQFRYKSFKSPRIYIEFQLPSKHKGYFDRLRHMLLYKPHAISKLGDIALFNKMERIKLAYLILNQYINVGNLHLLSAELFALNDNFEKYGTVGDLRKNGDQFHFHSVNPEKQINQEDIRNTGYKQIKGGLEGTHLTQGWRAIMIWKSDFSVIRAYMGESHAFSIFVKTRLILFLFVLGLIGIGGEMIKRFIISPAAQVAAYTPEIIFNFSYIFIITVTYSVFMETFQREEKQFLQNYQEIDPAKVHRKDYKGPYIRNISTDKINDFPQIQYSLFDKLKLFFNYVIILLFFIGMTGLYYGCRRLIIVLSGQIANFNKDIVYFLYPSRFIGYIIFLVTSQGLARLVMHPLLNKMTLFENWATEEQFTKSAKNKIYLTFISIQMIAPIDLVFIQYTTKAYCSSFWCYKDLEAYTYSHYFVLILVLFLLSLQLITNTIKIYRSKKKAKRLVLNKQKNIINDQFTYKLSNFLDFVYKQSKKKHSERVDLFEETVELATFGIFLIIFPFGAFISFITSFLSYIIQRRHIITNSRRPISKSQKIQTYSGKVRIVFHWMLVFNISQMIIVLEWLQLKFQNFTLTIVPNPNLNGMLLLNYCVILVLLMIFELISIIVRKIVRKIGGNIDQRKKNMYDSFIQNKGKKDQEHQIIIHQPRPLATVSRVFFNNKKQKKIQKQYQILIAQFTNLIDGQQQLQRQEKQERQKISKRKRRQLKKQQQIRQKIRQEILQDYETEM